MVYLFPVADTTSTGCSTNGEAPVSEAQSCHPHHIPFQALQHRGRPAGRNLGTCLERSKSIPVLTFPFSISISSKPQSLAVPSLKNAPSPNLRASHLLPASGVRINSVTEQHPARRGRFLSAVSERVSAMTVAAWLTKRMRLCTPGQRCSRVIMKRSRKSATRWCSSSTSSPVRGGTHKEDHASASIWGKCAWRSTADEGRG